MSDTLFDALGGLDGVRALVDRFYDAMDEMPEAAGIRAMHPDDLASSREKLYLFLAGWTGGPPLYFERHGHPRLRARHLPFRIGSSERDQWMACMDRALREQGVPVTLHEELTRAFRQVANFMRNVPEDVEQPALRAPSAGPTEDSGPADGGGES